MIQLNITILGKFYNAISSQVITHYHNYDNKVPQYHTHTAQKIPKKSDLR